MKCGSVAKLIPVARQLFKLDAAVHAAYASTGSDGNILLCASQEGGNCLVME